MNNSVYVEVYTSSEDYLKNGQLRLPLESFITLCIYKYCTTEQVVLQLIPTNKQTDDEVTLKLDDKFNFLDKVDVPWSVAMCVYPVAFLEDTVVTGLCAVARHICKYRSSPSSSQEHEEGLLGFRKSCLQAPNEVSIWTKFCEIDLMRTVKKLLMSKTLSELPINLARFESHLSKPVRVHNVYKIARNLKKESLPSVCSEKNSVPSEVEQPIDKEKNRVPKTRKWKSNLKKELEIDCSTKIEDLDVAHQFAEGPFITLADLILLPMNHIIIQLIGLDNFKSKLPLTHTWFQIIMNIHELEPVKKIINSICCQPLHVRNLLVPKTNDISLYKCDPKRHNPKKRLFTKEVDIEVALHMLNNEMEIKVTDNEHNVGSINWIDIPDGANPTAGHLPDQRMARKTQQLENLTLAALSIAKDGDLIVDFCCGSGHLGILLAHLLPNCTVILLENKEQSLLRARKRVHDMRLTNVYFYQCNLDFFTGKFDVGIALHACGIASDLVLDKCLKANAKFVLCPCCYGSLHATDRLNYPRSEKFSSVSVDQYMCIGHAADQTHEDHPLTVRGARCMGVIDSDRGRLAEEFGYRVTLSRLKPLTCTPKNNLLIGVPS